MKTHRKPWHQRDTMSGPGDPPPQVCECGATSNQTGFTGDLCDACADEQTSIEEQERIEQIERDAHAADVVMEIARNAYHDLCDAEVGS